MRDLLLKLPLLQDALEGARSRPGRFALSLFAMTVGMAVLAAMLALLDGLEQRSIQLSAELGTNVIAILPAPGNANSNLSAQHADLLRTNYPGARVSAATRTVLPAAGNTAAVTVMGVDHDMAAIRQWHLGRGRFFDPVDLRDHSRYAVITAALSEHRQWELGSTILLNRTPFVVIGILASRSGTLAGDETDQRLITGEHTVFIPRTVSAGWARKPERSLAVDAIFVRPAGNQTAEAALPGMRNLLSQPGLASEGLSWMIPETLIRGVRKMQQTIALTVGVVAALCLILGGTTLSSLLVANVRERIAEIGLRRALGATRRDITLLFIVEGCLATVAAAVVGSLLVHFLLLQPFPIMDSLPLHLGARTLFLPIVFALLLGVTFSWWPARSAAAIRPAEALRND